MTFTPWMPIMAQGIAACVAPYAQWIQPFTEYSATGWSKPQWRFDPDLGEVEYRGLAKTTAAVGSTSLVVIQCVMPTTATLPKPPLPRMAMAQTAHTPALARNSAVVRLDMSAGSGAVHHTVMWELTGAAAVPTGTWLYLNARWSLATPSGWSAWLPIKAFGYAGTEVHARFGTATLAAYNPGWTQPEWRYNGSRIQVRGLYNTIAAQASGDPILLFRFPAPAIQVTRRIILPSMVHVITTNGYQEFARVDLAPLASGFQLMWSTAPWLPYTAYFWLEMDFDLTFFTSGS